MLRHGLAQRAPARTYIRFIRCTMHTVFIHYVPSIQRVGRCIVRVYVRMVYYICVADLEGTWPVVHGEAVEPQR